MCITWAEIKLNNVNMINKKSVGNEQKKFYLNFYTFIKYMFLLIFSHLRKSWVIFYFKRADLYF